MLDSVSQTIGVEYENIVFDNRQKNFGLCAAYNKAAEKANGDYLCFVHEDIVIKTNGWGKELIEFAEHNNDCGVIGISGSKYANRNFVGLVHTRGRLINVYSHGGGGGN
jgi:glycosyltransferase involved in cell wall biosynthesis